MSQMLYLELRLMQEAGDQKRKFLCAFTGEMEAKGLVEDDQSPYWLAERVNALADLLGAAEIGSTNGAARSTFKPFFALLLYNGGLALLQQDVAPMTRRLEELSTTLPGVDIVHVLCHVPRLLYTPDAVSSVQAAVEKLVAIYPYRVADKREEILKLVEEYPELLLR
ncbi:hypothetical protein DUNSADRAFT_11879 [Dunaliella salina]|uniref:Uncharacterized protein n=1 Tax=Dunaliella salina TaxID=3046 RepID=A0ABQ7H486_DUNSA|nr:hypothetical protein DUNSADRAFT_11879 [Dunaliella salina]|eukprot:KAF5841672.1 hypothetical protein DUNSADRAFT_11879 [Dunaliella salina]